MFSHYRDLLLDKFHERRLQNPRYSLRQFAKDIGIPASKLSLNLRGLCGISSARAQEIAMRLQLEAEDTKNFVMAVEACHGRSCIIRERAKVELEKNRGQQPPPEPLTVMSLSLESVDSQSVHEKMQECLDQLEDLIRSGPQVATYSLVLNRH